MEARLLFLCQFGGVGSRRQILPQFLWLCHAGNHYGDVGVGADVAQSQGGFLDGAAGKGLHADKADVRFRRFCNQVFRLGLYNIIREHERFYPGQLQRHAKGVQRVGGHADMANLSGSLCFQQRFQRAAGGRDHLQLLRGQVVKLVQVDVVRS